MQLTTNLKLKKPEIADAVNIDDLNSNADTIDTEVAKIASTSQAGRMSTTDKTKLDGIQAGAQVNAVTSVASRTGAVTLSKTDVGLSSVDNAKQATKTEFDGHVADEVKHITAAERTSWNAKASTAAATSSAAGLMAAVDKSKLDGIAAGANNYVHPANHPASIITQDASNRFVTDAEKAAWNAKASTGVVTTSVAGLMAAADKSKLDGIATGANNYIHPATHSPSIISQDANNRFVTDAERIVWNNKASTDFVQSEIDNKSVKKEIVLPLNTDLDNVVSTGFYRLQSGNLNAPVGSDWSQMIVSHAGGDTVGQMILGHGSGSMYVRTGNPPAAGGTGVWTIWRRVEFKNDVFQAYPHIDQSTVWLNSPDFPSAGLAGFTANFISSIDTVITHIAINNVKYPVSNEGEGTVSLVNNGTYAFVWSHGYFFLRSGGGGGKLNVYTGATEPIKKEGVWIRSAITKGDVISDDSLYANGSWYNGPLVVTVPITGGSASSIGANTMVDVDGSVYHLLSSSTSSSGGVGLFSRYNKANNTWTTLTPPSGLAHMGANQAHMVHYMGAIFVIGYYRPTTVLKYTIATNIWTTLANVSYSPELASKVVIDDKIYFIQAGSSTSQVFNMSTNTFSVIRSVSGSGTKLFIALIGGFIYSVAYGSTQVNKYTIATNLWEIASFTSSANYLTGSSGLVQIGNDVYFILNVASTRGLYKATVTGSSITAVKIVDMPEAESYFNIFFTDNSLWCFKASTTTNSVVHIASRLMLNSKPYKLNSIIFMRSSESGGVYNAELVSSKAFTGVNSRLLSWFDDVGYYNGSNVLLSLPTYIGNGSAWVQIK
ncbi:pyocin knob domain-containing protein [Paenibacillus endoradicis]|uniref:pyocin knob domain-containing protein n=1 Tax=Paenibacillus endoradicis TaxID=2972487 RepID=UPI002158C098|nr:pyocin knob domain-containing protein [Paenibacillus endoradicis]MCR8658970.1 pyocin knob domain-containing protein [Paenibacillus endoradicis]